jgi:hypothetical protein
MGVPVTRDEAPPWTNTSTGAGVTVARGRQMLSRNGSPSNVV